MIEDFPKTDQSAGRLVAREALAHLAGALLFPFGLRRSRARTPRLESQRTVVLVHGYIANRSCLLPLRAYLRAVGVRQILCFDYPFNAGIEQAARALKDYLRRHVRGGRIDLVCHSLGGVIARVYVQELGGARRVDRCITLGTPHRGTYNSYWVASRVGSDLRPDSRLMARLEASRERGRRVKFTSYVGGADNIVIPRVFAVSGEDTVYVPNVGHMGLLFSPAVFQSVARKLTER